MELTDLRCQKEVPSDAWKRRTNLRRYKDIPSRSQIYESEIPFSLDNLFSYKQTFFLSGILLSGATLHNWRPHFARMIFLHMYMKTYT